MESIMQLTVDGCPREALVFSSGSMPPSAKHPLVFAFHPHGGTMQASSVHMGIQNLWPEAIVVYPQGLDTPTLGPVDPSGHATGWQVEVNQPDGVGNRDLEFFDAMLATIEQDHVVDNKRIYATGFSNGGFFSYLLWAERGQKLAAIGECAGRLWGIGASEHLTVPRPLLAIAGEDDMTDHFADQKATIDAALVVNHATGSGISCGPMCTFYPSTIQAPVKTYIVPHGCPHAGHVYPAWAPEVIAGFFKTHALP
ncbi:MAG: polyhydroxybutyrate depolymerase [Chloroflexota bacterium]|jgi:polyhydroxybutyrate depolymerase|nr:polyhydroxybutyrate depolymerase [Chloroflexota bacterium]